MTDTQKVELIDNIIKNLYDGMPDSKEKAAYLEGILVAISAVLEMKGVNEND